MSLRCVSACRLTLILAACVAASAAEPAEPLTGETRIHYIAADEVEWNYAPAGNVVQSLECCGDDAPWLKRGPNARPPIFKKAVFREYTDETFTRLKPRDVAWEHAGILGPIIRAEVGDRVEVTLKNHTSFPVSLHAHGVHYLKPYEGASYPDGTTGSDKDDEAVAPNDHYTYRWQVADGMPRDVDREFVTLFTNFDETQSRFATRNAPLLSASGDTSLNRFHSINGYIFGNLPMLQMKAGERVRWYLVALGDGTDLHTPHWHGNTVLHEGRRTDVVELLPASMKVADMRADNPGTWLYHCHVNDHVRAGMVGRYEIAK
jgi:FtsP/CotA-like multicopper oxidase with cupredoxin domain